MAVAETLQMPLTRKQTGLLADSGLIEDPERWELLDGRLLEKMPQNPPHRRSYRLTMAALRAVYGEEFDVNGGVTLPMGERSEPEPDVTVLRGDARALADREEGPEDAVLLVEIVNTRPDTAEAKISLYARHGIPEYWIVRTDLRRLVTHRGPRPDGSWAEVRLYEEGDSVPVPETDREVPVTDLLPPVSAA